MHIEPGVLFDTRNGPVKLGDRFPTGDLKEDKDRTYSFGVAGLFE